MRPFWWFAVGVVIGRLLLVPILADNFLANGRDSVSGLPVPIQTDGANALKVTGQ